MYSKKQKGIYSILKEWIADYQWAGFISIVGIVSAWTNTIVDETHSELGLTAHFLPNTHPDTSGRTVASFQKCFH